MVLRLAAALSLLAVLSLVSLACGGAAAPANLGGVAVSNRLTIQVHGVELVERLVYQEDGQTYAVAPAPGQRLVAVEATLTNPEAEAAILVISPDSATLSDRKNDSFSLQDPRGNRQATPDATAPKYYTPFLWGSFTLKRGFGVRGWLFFQVPEGLQLQSLASLSWRSLDSLSVRLTPQQR